MDNLTQREITCCFTGHRILPKQALPELTRKLEETLKALIRQDIRYFSAGGALGFDTLAALTVLRLREEFPQIRLILVLPCRNQTNGWREKDVQKYRWILSQADKAVWLNEEYTAGCTQERNRYLVDHSGTCVCFLTKKTGGTAYTVRYAKSRQSRIINLA